MAVGLLHVLAGVDPFDVEWGDLDGWLSEAPAEDTVGATVLLVALALGYWLLLSTIWYWMASRSGRATVVEAAGLLTLPAIRRLVGRAVALSLAASSITMPSHPVNAAWFDDGPMARVLVVDQPGPAPPGAESAGTDDVIVPPHLRNIGDDRPSSVNETPPEPTPDDRLDPTGTYSHRVERGDHLWGISESHLQAVTGRTDLGEHEIAPYWIKVIDANRSSIRSGNPDLIYPGEIVTLAPVATPSDS